MDTRRRQRQSPPQRLAKPPPLAIPRGLPARLLTCLRSKGGGTHKYGRFNEAHRKGTPYCWYVHSKLNHICHTHDNSF